jgi:putative PEP-CTERM system TPR-repeat lipoprotein
MKKPKPRFAAALSTVLLSAVLAACTGESPDALIASSKDFIAKNDNKAAVIQLKNALQKDPNLGEARLLLGKTLLDSGDVTGAEVELRKALALNYARERTLPLLAKAMLASGQAKKLIDEFAKAEVPAGEASANLNTTLSIAYSTQGKAEAAQTALDAALAAQADYAPAKLLEARNKAANQKLDEAGNIVDGVLAKNPRDHEALLLKGFLQAAKGDGEGALAFHRKAVEAKPDFLPAHAAIISSLFAQQKFDEANKQIEALKKVAPGHPQTLYFQAQASYQRQDYKTARELTQQLLKIGPNNPNSLQLAGAIEFQLRSYPQAEAFLTQALQQSPGLPLARRLLVVSYLRSGQPVKALAALQPVIKSIDNDASFLALAGETYLQNGDANKAAEYFTKASKLEPNDAGKKTALGLAHMAQGHTASALDELEQISLSDKGTTADLALIATYLRNNQSDKALKAIATLDKKQPDNPATQNLRGRTLLAQKDVQGARQSFEKALALNPGFFPAASSLAALDMADKKPDDARKRFESVLAADPKNTQAMLGLAALRAAANGSVDEVAGLIGKAVTTSPSDVMPRLALTQYYLEHKEAKKALAAANDAVAAIPDKPEILDALGRSQQAAGDLNQALITYTKLASLQPSSPVPHMRMAEIYLNGKNKLDAEKSLKHALELKPDLVDVQRGLILLALDAKNNAGALAIARQVQKQRPTEAVGFALEGDVHAAVKELPEAISSYRSAMKLTQAPEIAIKLYSLLLTSGNGGEAEKIATAWHREHPKDIGLHLHQGDIANARKDFAQAVQHYRAALDIQPDNPLILNNLAWALGQQKSPKAIEYAEKANQLAPNQPALMDTLAMLLAAKGEPAKAIDLLRRALVIAPQAAPIQLNLAKTLIGAGKKDEARKELEALAKLGDKFPGQDEVSRLQKEL